MQWMNKSKAENLPISDVTSRSLNNFTELEVRNLIMEFRREMNDNMNKRDEKLIGFTETNDWIRNRVNDL